MEIRFSVSVRHACNNGEQTIFSSEFFVGRRSHNCGVTWRSLQNACVVGTLSSGCPITDVVLRAGE